jgi:indole-3-glycerol phosphate synthase
LRFAKLKKNAVEGKNLLTFLTSNAKRQRYCEVYQETVETISGSGIASHELQRLTSRIFQAANA